MCAHEELEGRCERVLRRMMGRVGALARHAYPQEGGALDAPQYTAVLPVGAEELLITSRKFLRRMACLFLALLRTLSLTSRVEVVAVRPSARADHLARADA